MDKGAGAQQTATQVASPVADIILYYTVYFFLGYFTDLAEAPNDNANQTWR